jgi:hypothetical protein
MATRKAPPMIAEGDDDGVLDDRDDVFEFVERDLGIVDVARGPLTPKQSK